MTDEIMVFNYNLSYGYHSLNGIIKCNIKSKSEILGLKLLNDVGECADNFVLFLQLQFLFLVLSEKLKHINSLIPNSFLAIS